MNPSAEAVHYFFNLKHHTESKLMETIPRFDSASIGYVYCVPEGKSELETVPIRYDKFVAGLFKQEGYPQMLMHAALGVCGEAGELGDAIKKHVVYGKPLDRDNIVEELGDLRFYIQAVMNCVGITETEILQTNGYKLFKRYKGGTYNDKAALERADKTEGPPIIGSEEC